MEWLLDWQEDYNLWNFWKLPLPDIEDELKRLAKAIDLSRPTFDTFGSDKLIFYDDIVAAYGVTPFGRKVGNAGSGLLVTVII